MKWTWTDLPDLSGRSFIASGANSGIGVEAGRALARRDVRIVMGCRNPQRASSAVDTLRRESPDASIEPKALDLASLASSSKKAR